MKRVLTIFLLFITLLAFADERGEARLGRISRYYSAMGNYTLSFAVRGGDAEQSGELMVEGNNSYMRVADTEVYVVDSLRYEVRRAAKEIVLDRADAYEKELLNPLSGFSNVAANYEITESVVDGRVVVVLTPKKSGEVVSVVTAVDGESIEKVRYGAGENQIVIEVKRCRKSVNSLPKFAKEQYEGFEFIDFR